MKPAHWSSIRTHTVEFIVVVLGITVSFALDGWRQDRIISELHLSEIRSLLEDLEQDRERLSEVFGMIEEGDSNMQRIIGDVMAYRSGALSYDQLAATLEDIGTPYQYGTFYMNTSTYKSLVATGRLQLFPEDINRKLRDYYEYVSKRVDDNNAIVDRITLAYYNEHHPWVNASTFPGIGLESGTEVTVNPFFIDPDVRRKYSDITFLNSSLALADRIRIHRGQLIRYNELRDELAALLHDL